MEDTTMYIQIPVSEYQDLIKARYALQVISETKDSSYGYTTNVIDAIFKALKH